VAGSGELVDEYAAWSTDFTLDENVFGALVLRLAGQVARTRTFPHPHGYPRWTDQAVEELAAKVYRKAGKDFALKILEQATSQQSLERLILATIRNFLIDEAKATETGKLRRRLENVLPTDPQKRFEFFTSPFDAWALVGAPDTVWQGDPEQLEAAARAVRGYTIDRWNEGGPTPRLVKEALWETSAGILGWARARVEAQRLAAALRVRYIHISRLDLTSLSDLHAEDEPAADTSAGTEVEALRNVTVDEIWASLSPLEQQVLAHAGEPAKNWASEYGLRPNEAKLVAARAAEKVRLAVLGDSDAEKIVLDLRGRSIGTNLKSDESRRQSSTDPESSGRGESDA
jgi:hypothetical protein